MKFAILSYENKKLRLDGTDVQNLGDWIQVIATEILFHEWGIKDYIRISRNNLSEYAGEKVTLLFNGWNSFSELGTYTANQFPIPDSIFPIFFSFNLEGNYIPEKSKLQFLKYGPIGCRDEGTWKRLQRQGISSYISGCLTSLIPKREEVKEKQTKVVFVDVPPAFFEYIPKNIMEDVEYRTNSYKIMRTYGEHKMTEEESVEAYKEAKKQLEYLRDNARLVVTSRLHIASPCIAMGIPVIVVKEDFDERFAWIEKYVKLYTKKEWSNVDWKIQPINYENEKKSIKAILRSILFSQTVKETDMNFLNYYYRNRKSVEYNGIITKGFANLKQECKAYSKYALCGISIDTITLQNMVKDIYPDWELSDVYDSDIGEKRYFEGQLVKTLNGIEKNEDTLYLIATKKAQRYAVSILSQNNCKYIIIDYKNDAWINNI